MYDLSKGARSEGSAGDASLKLVFLGCLFFSSGHLQCVEVPDLEFVPSEEPFPPALAYILLGPWCRWQRELVVFGEGRRKLHGNLPATSATYRSDGLSKVSHRSNISGFCSFGRKTTSNMCCMNPHDSLQLDDVIGSQPLAFSSQDYHLLLSMLVPLQNLFALHL